MENQHRHISGYRDLSAHEIDAMNRLKKLAEECFEVFASVRDTVECDSRAMALASTNMQQAFMWANRAVAKPESFG